MPARTSTSRVPNAGGTHSIIRDYAGQRFEKKVTTKGDITTLHRFTEAICIQLSETNPDIECKTIYRNENSKSKM